MIDKGKNRVSIWKRKRLCERGVARCFVKFCHFFCFDKILARAALFGKEIKNVRESENIRERLKKEKKKRSLRPYSLSSFPSTLFLLNLGSVLPPSPNNVLLIISPWLACLCGWALCPDPLMGICDAPNSLLKWLAGARSFDVPGSGETGCTLACTNLVVAQLHFALRSPCLQPWLVGWLVGWLSDWFTPLVNFVPAEKVPAAERLTLCRRWSLIDDTVGQLHTVYSNYTV